MNIREARPKKTVKEALVAMRSILADPYSWVPKPSLLPGKYTVHEAIALSAAGDENSQTRWAVIDMLHAQFFNDDSDEIGLSTWCEMHGRTHAEVVDLIDRAINETDKTPSQKSRSLSTSKIKWLVAERVMRWTLEDHDTVDGIYWWVDAEKKDTGYTKHNWDPSEDLKQAFEIVDVTTCSTQEVWTINVFSTGFFVEFDYAGGRDRPWKPGTYNTIHENLATAICLVALKAVGVSEEEISV